MVVVVVVVVTHFLRAPCFKTGYAGSAGKRLDAAGLHMVRRNWVLRGWKQQGCKRL